MDIFTLLGNDPAIPPFQGGKGVFDVDENIGVPLLLSASYIKEKKKYLVIAPNLYKAQKLYGLLTSFLGPERVFIFPSDELIRAESVAEGKEMVSQRLYALDAIQSGSADIVIANVAAAVRFLPAPSLFESHSIRFRVGDKVDLKETKRRLALSGYEMVSKVDQSLQFAVRGDIIDVCPVNLQNPIRIELFDDEVESIRYFDLATQISISQVSEAVVLPATDALFTDEEIKEGTKKIYDSLDKDEKRLPPDLRVHLREVTDEDISDILERRTSARTYRYFPLLSSSLFTIFDYCKDMTEIYVNHEQVKSEIELLVNESQDYFAALVQSGNLISGLESVNDFTKRINKSRSIMTEESIGGTETHRFDMRPVPFLASKEGDAENIIRVYLNQDYRIILSIGTNEQVNVLEELFERTHLPYEHVKLLSLPEKSHIGIDISTLEQGFVFESQKIVVLTSRELFNTRIHAVRYSSRFKEATILKSYEDLEPGDYVVHEYQGIGRFETLQTLVVDGMHKDFLKIIYAGDEILYVPLSQFQLVRKYMGKEGKVPKLSRLHSKDWENAKKRIKERVNELADRLMKLYTERSKVQGFAFNKDDELQNEFESGFPYPLTADQERSLQEIKRDMESPFPMDRLLCGDVGFGKTEVAFRAAFKAISSGKQAAILCPTTILARQHYERAIERFSPYDIKIAIFSRFVPESTQREYIKGLADGSIHLAIGTHRLLSKEIVYKEIGLLIVDEEQRFGVEQKERIKELKSNIDVLTLTATPIPRTLQISMLGMRSLSMINTAPQDRMPVQTYVIPKRNDLIKELIERELGRNGQVFYLHNSIATLHSTALRIQKMVPDAVIGVAHGQMDRGEVEDVMMKFYSGAIDILVSTSIIENGIDVPNANMIIVEDSDEYGLSQLYQIKGRVGRSDRIAYAYLMYNGEKVMNEKAQKRLKAIKDFTALGSGYKIAQRDLMIRGAGDILGPDQAGFIDSIGLEMYIKLLNEAIKEKLTGTTETDIPEASIDLDVDAYIPSKYASDSDKIEIYQSIKDAKTIEDLSSIKLRTRDIFGRIPESVELLFKKQAIDIYSDSTDIEKMAVTRNDVSITLGDSFLKIKGIGNILFESLVPYMSFIRVSYLGHKFRIRMEKRKGWIDDLEGIMRSLSQITHKSGKM